MPGVISVNVPTLASAVFPYISAGQFDLTSIYADGGLITSNSGSLNMSGTLTIHDLNAQIFVRLNQKDNNEGVWSWNVNGDNGDTIDDSSMAAYKMSLDNNRFELQTMLATADDWSTEIAAFGYNLAADNFYTHGDITVGNNLYLGGQNYSIDNAGNGSFRTIVATGTTSFALGAITTDNSGNMKIAGGKISFNSNAYMTDGQLITNATTASVDWNSRWLRGTANEVVLDYNGPGIITDGGRFSTDGSGNTTIGGTLSVFSYIFPHQSITSDAPSYVKGGIYFDTTLNKLRVGGATAWETITSV